MKFSHRWARDDRARQPGNETKRCERCGLCAIATNAGLVYQWSYAQRTIESMPPCPKAEGAPAWPSAVYEIGEDLEKGRMLEMRKGRRVRVDFRLKPETVRYREAK